MTTFTNIYHTLCVLFLLASTTVLPFPYSRGRQHFSVASFLTDKGSVEQLPDLRACCARHNAHIASAGHIAPASRQTSWASVMSPSVVQRIIKEDGSRHTYGPRVLFTSSGVYEKADSVPLVSPSFLQIVSAQISTDPHIGYAEHLGARHLSDAFLQPGSSTQSSRVNPQYKLPAFMSLPDTAPRDKKPVFLYRTSAQASPEGKRPVQDADVHEESTHTRIPHKVGDVSFSEKEAAGTSEQTQWYAMRTNFPPRFLRILARKNEADEKQEWYTLLTNFKPQILKLTPE